MPIKIKRKNGKVTRYKNAEYIPLFYFLPKSLLYKCGELPFQISRYPYELFTDWKQVELIESDQFALLMYDAFHYLVWDYMGLNVGREIYSGEHPAWKFSHAPSFWIKTMQEEGVLSPIESLVNDIQPTTFFGFVSDEYVDAVLKDIVPKTMERFGMNEILAVVKEYQCFEDFDYRYSQQKNDFKNSYYHKKTKHPMISLEAFQEDYKKNHAYLRLAQGLLEYGWLINLLLSASPVCDGSYFNPDRLGETVATDYASIRCGKEGYWNNFTPILYYGDILEYAGSIQRYLSSGTLAGVGELYYPIRLKPKGANRLNNLVQNGVNHIELRNIDINPFTKSGLDVRDLQFIELLCLWIYSNYKDKLSYNDQIRVIENQKNAALYDIDSTTINGKEPLREAGLRVLGEMKAFYGETELIKYQIQKLTEPGKRYAERVCVSLKNNYIT